MEPTLREAAESVARTVGRSFDFYGRSRRLEVGYFWIASTLVNSAAHEAIGFGLDWTSAFFVGQAIQFLLFVPCFALFVRRLHDIGRSGWWALFLPPIIALSLYERLRVHFHAFDPAWSSLGSWTLLLAIPIVLLSLAVLFIPGEVAENRFGPDPRLTQSEPNAA